MALALHRLEYPTLPIFRRPEPKLNSSISLGPDRKGGTRREGYRVLRKVGNCKSTPAMDGVLNQEYRVLRKGGNCKPTRAMDGVRDQDFRILRKGGNCKPTRAVDEGVIE